MAQLIVNADDLGVGHETDLGIFEAKCLGIATSASLLVTGTTARQAALEAARLKLPLGIHLNLSEGRPLCGPISGLTDREGSFLGKAACREALMRGDYDAEQVFAEFVCQVETARNWGVHPDHLDTHQHVFLFPGITELVIRLATELRIDALRFPCPCALPGCSPVPEFAGDLARYRSLSRRTRTLLKEAGLRVPQGLFGMDCLNQLDRERLIQLAKALPDEGSWELMVHPGYPDPANPFSGPERKTELSALTDSAVKQTFSSRGINLISFADLTCAS